MPLWVAMQFVYWGWRLDPWAILKRYSVADGKWTQSPAVDFLFNQQH